MAQNPKIVITDINQGDTVSFQLYSEFLDPEFSNKIVFDAPKFPMRMDTVKLTVQPENTASQQEVVNPSASFYIKKFKVIRNGSKTPKSSYRNIKLFLNDDANLSKLLSGEKIEFATSATGALKNFNGQSFSIKDYNPLDKSVMVFNMLASSFDPTSAGDVGTTTTLSPPATVTDNAIVLKNIVKQTKPFKIIVPIEQLNSLIYTDNVRDFFIFTYASSNAAIDAKKLTDRYLVGDSDNTKVDWMVDPAVSIKPTPPSYAKVLSLYNKKRIIKHYQSVPTNKPNFGNVVFWVAVARYKKNSAGVWSGSWLQQDDNKTVYWAESTQGGIK